MPARSVQNPKPGPSKVTPIKRTVMTSPTGVEYEVMTVTPAQAELWLAKNVGNRNMRKSAAGRYGRDMEAGAWRENGSAIVFADDGTLIDGQHRLEGCARTGTPFVSLVIRNVTRDTQNTLDDGAKRTLADRFTFIGHTHAAAGAAIARRILLWEAGYQTNTGGYQPSTREAIDLIEKDTTVQTAIECAVAMRGSKLLPPSIIGLAWWLFWDIDPDGCQTFWDGLHIGAGLDEDSPVLVLRNQIIKKAGEPGRIPETVMLAWVIKAWNDFRDERVRIRPYNLRAGEKFPEPK